MIKPTTQPGNTTGPDVATTPAQHPAEAAQSGAMGAEAQLSDLASPEPTSPKAARPKATKTGKGKGKAKMTEKGKGKAKTASTLVKESKATPLAAADPATPPGPKKAKAKMQGETTADKNRTATRKAKRGTAMPVRSTAQEGAESGESVSGELGTGEAGAGKSGAGKSDGLESPSVESADLESPSAESVDLGSSGAEPSDLESSGAESADLASTGLESVVGEAGPLDAVTIAATPIAPSSNEPSPESAPEPDPEPNLVAASASRPESIAIPDFVPVFSLESRSGLTLREVAYGAIQQHFRKATKARKAVLKDQEPEPLHQMRVGLRRLRSTLHTFRAVVEIPKPGRDRALAYLSRQLGSVRDLDVLQVDLSRRSLPQLTLKEQKRLEGVLRQIQQQRLQNFRSMEAVLSGDRYKAFKRTYRLWLLEPQFTILGERTWATEAPDLLLFLFCDLFQHPGWLFGTQMHQGQLQVLPWAEHGPTLTALLQDPDRNQQLHALRKTIKRVRYQSELFQPLYGSTLKEMIQDLKRGQELLGQWQDLQVQQATIDGYLNKSIASHLPTLVALFEETQANLWQQWQPIQQQYLDPQYRHHIRTVLLQAL